MTTALNIEDLRFTPPSLSEADLLIHVRASHGLRGELQALSGERDQNFRLIDEEGDQWLLKVASPLEPPALVDFQIEALRHIEREAPLLPVPRMRPDLKGDFCSVLQAPDGQEYRVRLLSFIPGTPLSQLDAIDEPTVRAVGAMQARLCKALSGFRHPAEGLFMPWDTMNGLVTSSQLRSYIPDHLLKDCEPALEFLQAEALPALATLPSQVIHNDGHSGNVLYDASRPGEVVGIIDFGDMVHRPVIVDLAVSLVSLCEHGNSIIAAARNLLAGFQSELALPQAQLELLYDALLARSLLTVQLLGFRCRHRAAGHESIRKYDLPQSIATLQSIIETPRETFNEALRASAGA